MVVTSFQFSVGDPFQHLLRVFDYSYFSSVQPTVYFEGPLVRTAWKLQQT